jgi:glutamate carboxypeptidase
MHPAVRTIATAIIAALAATAAVAPVEPVMQQAHANDEYILVSSIEPRLYLATRLIMDVSQNKVQ